jgi:ribosome modulation factor
MTDETELPETVSDEGAASYLRGLPLEDCPYPPGTDEREEWLTGWDLAVARAT